MAAEQTALLNAKKCLSTIQLLPASCGANGLSSSKLWRIASRSGGKSCLRMSCHVPLQLARPMFACVQSGLGFATGEKKTYSTTIARLCCLPLESLRQQTRQKQPSFAGSCSTNYGSGPRQLWWLIILRLYQLWRL